MDKTQVKHKLALHGFAYAPLDSGVRVSALVPAGSRAGSEEAPEIVVRATREGACLESERHASYGDAAARYVELVGTYGEDSRAPSHGPIYTNSDS